jgi:hypothetical protein
MAVKNGNITGMKMTVFWDTVMCSLVEIDPCFRGAYCLHHQGNDSSPWLWRQQVPLKRLISTRLQCATSQKTVCHLHTPCYCVFISVFVYLVSVCLSLHTCLFCIYSDKFMCLLICVFFCVLSPGVLCFIVSVFFQFVCMSVFMYDGESNENRKNFFKINLFN